jgi:DNA repair protein RecO (recombination protein O)
MYTDTEGIVLKQIKAVNGRRIIVLLSEKFGKISAGTSLSERGKGKSTLAVKPFTHGRYEINRTRGVYHINRADVLHSHYRIGEDMERYVNCSYVLELTEKLLPEEEPAAWMLSLLADYLTIMERRGQAYDAVTLAYLLKTLRACGVAPQMEACVVCGAAPRSDGLRFSGRAGGVLCESCVENVEKNAKDPLLYPINFGIVGVVRYLTERPLADLERLALDGALAGALRRILKDHVSYHLEVGRLKSETFLT